MAVLMRDSARGLALGFFGMVGSRALGLERGLEAGGDAPGALAEGVEMAVGAGEIVLDVGQRRERLFVEGAVARFLFGGSAPRSFRRFGTRFSEQRRRTRALRRPRRKFELFNVNGALGARFEGAGSTIVSGRSSIALRAPAIVYSSW
jgi:hypothetical protein